MYVKHSPVTFSVVLPTPDIDPLILLMYALQRITLPSSSVRSCESL